MIQFIKRYFNNEIRIMFEKELSIRENRIKDLERTIEQFQGTNSILERELEKAQIQEQNLLNKIFELTGVNKKENIRVEIPSNKTDFINLARKGANWQTVREQLEKKTYWEAKQAKETKTGIESKGVEDASSIA
jgi:predicted RNase H-like nuclease (RuvC/YqgF family)